MSPPSDLQTIIPDRWTSEARPVLGLSTISPRISLRFVSTAIRWMVVTHTRSITPQDSPAGCAESSWERAPDARGMECVSLAL